MGKEVLDEKSGSAWSFYKKLGEVSASATTSWQGLDWENENRELKQRRWRRQGRHLIKNESKFNQRFSYLIQIQLTTKFAAGRKKLNINGFDNCRSYGFLKFTVFYPVLICYPLIGNDYFEMLKDS